MGIWGILVVALTATSGMAQDSIGALTEGTGADVPSANMMQAEVASIVFTPSSYQTPTVSDITCNSRCKEWIHGTSASVTNTCDFANVCLNVCSVGHNHVDERNSELYVPYTPYPDVTGWTTYSADCKVALKNSATWCDTGDLYCTCSACSPNVVSDTDQREKLNDGQGTVVSDSIEGGQNQQAATVSDSAGAGQDVQETVVSDSSEDPETPTALSAVIPEAELALASVDAIEGTAMPEPVVESPAEDKDGEPPMPPPYAEEAATQEKADSPPPMPPPYDGGVRSAAETKEPEEDGN